MAESKKINFFRSIGKFFREFKSEIKKVVWPTPQSVFRNTGVVLLAITLIGLFVFGLDQGLFYLLKTVMNMSAPAGLGS